MTDIIDRLMASIAGCPGEREVLQDAIETVRQLRLTELELRAHVAFLESLERGGFGV